MFFRGRRHRELFMKEAAIHPKAGRRFTAALYLLTADSKLWYQSRDQVTVRDIRVEAIRPKMLSPEAYLYWCAARDLLQGTQTVGLAELADQGQKYPENFKVLVTALKICGGSWKADYQVRKRKEQSHGFQR